MTQEENKDIKEPEAEVQEVKEEQSAAPEVQAAPAEPSLEEQLDDMRCNYLRALAELENYRKRTARELQEERTKTRARTITDVLGIYDLLQMAVSHAASASDMNAIRQGLDMSFSELKKILGGLDVTVIDAVGQEFDPQLHEALSTAPSDTVPEGHVLQQWKAGFRMGDRLLRPASVIVSAGNPAAAPQESAAEATAAAEPAAE